MEVFYKLVFLILILSSSIFAKSQYGAISGLVLDAKTAESIIGANVLITGTHTGASTDLDGKFLIEKIDSGTYSLTISYISYKTIIIPNVHVEKNKITNINLKLEDITTVLKEVSITAKRRVDSEISVMSMIKSSQLVVSGISSQQINRTQDRDASEVIKRVPGVNIIDNRFIVVRGLSERYNVVWLNNVATPSSESDVKAFSFDNIPSSMLERIMIYKTPAPELPSDFAGGAVQIFTKNNPLKNALEISFSSSYRRGSTFKDFYMYKGSKTDWLGFDDGARALPKNFPNYSEMIQKENSANEADKQLITQWGHEMNKNWIASASKASPDLRFSAAFTHSKQLKKLSFTNVTSLNYSFTKQTNNIFRADYLTFDTVHDVSDTSYYFFDKQFTSTAKIGAINNWSFNVNKHFKLEFRNLFNQIGFTRTTLRDGRDNYGGITIKAYEYRFMSRSIYSGQLEGEHKYSGDKTLINWTLGYSYANKKEPDQKRLTSVLSEADPSDSHYGQYAMQFSTAANPELTGRIYTDMFENIFNFATNYSQKLNFKNFKYEIKAGVYIEKKNRQFNTRLLGYRIAKTSQFDWNLPYLPIESIFANDNINSTTGIKIDEKTNASDSYNASNQLNSAYLAFKIPIGSSLNLYAGLRIEKNRQELNSFQIDKTDAPVNINIDTINFYPSFNLSYNTGERSLFRLAYGKTINRPEFREIAPLLFYDFEKKAGIRGNPDLKNCYIHNYDLRYEFYPTLFEIFSVGVFYKKFINPIENKVIPAGSGLDYSFANANNAYDYGAEIELKKSLDFLKNFNTLLATLRNFNFIFNATYIKSMVKFQYGDLQTNRPLQGQSPYIVNAGIYYNNDSLGLMISLNYNVIGERIIYVGDPYSGNPDTYETSRNVIDLTIKKSFGKKIEIKGGIQDLLAETVVFRQKISYHQILADGTDNGMVSRNQTLFSYKPSTYWTLGFTYKF